MFPLENYLLLTPHEHDGVLLPAGALIALNKEQWHLLHTHDVVGDDPLPTNLSKTTLLLHTHDVVGDDPVVSCIRK